MTSHLRKRTTKTIYFNFDVNFSSADLSWGKKTFCWRSLWTSIRLLLEISSDSEGKVSNATIRPFVLRIYCILWLLLSIYSISTIPIRYTMSVEELDTENADKFLYQSFKELNYSQWQIKTKERNNVCKMKLVTILERSVIIYSCQIKSQK